MTGLAVRFEPIPSVPQAGEEIRWVFTVENQEERTHMLTFSSTQQGDVVLEADGVERYRWSNGKAFAAMMVERELPAGGELAFELDDVLTVEPGTYALLASVTSRPAPTPVRDEITVV
jgi:Intracellular proteinase inhibitor